MQPIDVTPIVEGMLIWLGVVGPLMICLGSIATAIQEIRHYGQVSRLMVVIAGTSGFITVVIVVLLWPYLKL